MDFSLPTSPYDKTDAKVSTGWYITPGEADAAVRAASYGRVRWWLYQHRIWVRLVVLPLVLLALIAVEMRTSLGQAILFSSWGQQMTYTVEAGPSDRIRYPEHGPYNRRLGYTQLGPMVDSLTDKHFQIDRQARMSATMASTMDLGSYPVYRHKDQAGLHILDHRDRSLFRAQYPGRVYTHPDSVPDLVWKTLLFIENRDLLNTQYEYKNPAVEWDRFAMAVAERLMTGGEGPGGSTLATQLTKVRHSPGGLTTSPAEKLRQMASASLQAYRTGMQTGTERRRIVMEYLNQLPLAATAGHGEVSGIGDGLWAWYGTDFEEANSRLRLEPDGVRPAPATVARRALTYRQVLSLILSTRSPSRFLVQDEGPEALNTLTDHYLPLLAEAGIISEQLRDMALGTRVSLLDRAPSRPVTSFVRRKAANSVRIDLLQHLNLTNLPALDRLDLTVETTIDREVQEAVSGVLERLEDSTYVQQMHLDGPRLLETGDVSDVIYSVVLYERTPTANVVRVQADNVDGPFDVNRGSMLELGSTAKLRTLITHLQLVEQVFDRHGWKAPAVLAQIPVADDDAITAWTLDYLQAHPGATRTDVLEAAVDREYDASPHEAFFTGGGLHTFSNFDPETKGVMSVRTALQRSVNLVFVRMMEEIVRYHVARLPGQPGSILEDASDPRRDEYLRRFAEQEGAQFLGRYLRAYREAAHQGKVLSALGDRHDLTAERLAWAYRSVFPESSRGAFRTYLREYAMDAPSLPDARLNDLYRDTNASDYSWQDRGYLASIHPLELWLVAYLHAHPDATYQAVMRASAQVRQDVYRWLFQKRKHSQDRRIRTIMEQEAFDRIHEMWAPMGYPFHQLVPTLATALGSSADRPAALAELVGILQRNGLRYPSIRIDSLHFAVDTPYEAHLSRRVEGPRRVLSPALAGVVRDAAINVVENGTAIRAKGAIPAPDGTPLVIGGKTGTGDNRIHFVKEDGTKDSIAMSRTSTFVFFAGDRFFGTVVAYVDGPEADAYRFTSSLPTAILKIIGPSLTPLLYDGEVPPSLATADGVSGS